MSVNFFAIILICNNMMTVLVFLSVICMFMICNGQKTCSGLDISNERRYPLDKIVGTWYLHLQEDNTPLGEIVPFDAKFTFVKIDDKTVITYFYGRNRSGDDCTTLLFSQTQIRRYSSCLITRFIFPELQEPGESILTLFPGDDKLLLSFCVNPPECTIHAAGGLTRRQFLCRGEKRMFLRKLREFGIPVNFRRFSPASNNCTVPGIRSERRRQKCPRRKVYGRI